VSYVSTLLTGFLGRRSLGATQPAATLVSLIPGLALTASVALAAVGLQLLEQKLLGRAWLESIALAILLGAAVRSVWILNPIWSAGIAFSARTLLEVAVVLLGASVSTATIMLLGWALPVWILGVVIVAIAGGFVLGRAFGLLPRMSLLVACGNSICGNSAIAAVAPVIGANAEDVACAIAFTAVIGVVTVVGLPFLGQAFKMSGLQFGVLSGMTVYAVPQVLAATAPMGTTAVHIGTLVKLIRVLMLGPVVLVLSVLTGIGKREATGAVVGGNIRARPKLNLPPLRRLVPWFIIGFALLAIARSTGLVPAFAITPASELANWLTILSMAALGLGVDLRVLAKVGLRVTAVVTLSLLALGGAALLVIRLARLG
jgi:uncharacterized integral membrane protein (TIGR00698 family)